MVGARQLAWVVSIGLVEVACLGALPPPASSAPETVEAPDGVEDTAAAEDTALETTEDTDAPDMTRAETSGPEDAVGASDAEAPTDLSAPADSAEDATPDGSGAAGCNARDAGSYALCVDGCVIHGQRFEVTVGSDASLRRVRIGDGDNLVDVVSTGPGVQEVSCAITSGGAFAEASKDGLTTRVLADGRIFVQGPDAAAFEVASTFLGATPVWLNPDGSGPRDARGPWICQGYCAERSGSSARSLAWHWQPGSRSGTCSVVEAGSVEGPWRLSVSSEGYRPSVVFKAAPQGCRTGGGQASNPVQLRSFPTSDLSCDGACDGLSWLADGLLTLDWPVTARERQATLSLPSGVTSFGVAIQLACSTNSDCPGRASCEAGHCRWPEQAFPPAPKVTSDGQTVAEVLAQPSRDSTRLIVVTPDLGPYRYFGEVRQVTLALSTP